ncbi:GTP cyclohydrolase I [Chloroflexi bacterium TSY]|nr:GTP cyclohydrolase I [Chloroflexi bacterium TSY]
MDIVNRSAHMTSQLTETISTLIEQLQIAGELTSSQDSAKRVAGMFGEVFAGVGQDPLEILHPLIPITESESELNIVSLSAVKFFSMCEHHFLPFYGCVDISYIPNQHITLLSGKGLSDKGQTERGGKKNPP